MNKTSLIKRVSTRAAASAAAALLILLSVHSCTDENGIDGAFLKQRKEAAPSVTDPRDGKTYRTVKVGSVNWTAENAAYDTKDVGSGCYGGIGANCEKYGRLYTWQSAAMDACPKGWRLPGDAEWADLRAAVGDEMRLLRAKSWADGEDKYGWTALPGGYRTAEGKYYFAGENGSWWSAAEDARAAVRDSARYWGIGSDPEYRGYKEFDDGPDHKAVMSSVRCVEDARGSARRYYVSFDAAGGTPGAIYAVGVDAGGSLGGRFPADPDRDGYAFDGWRDKTTSRQYTEGTAVNEDARLTAQWRPVPKYKVEFNVNGAPASVAAVQVDSGKAMGSKFPANPTWAAHTFEGWYEDGAAAAYTAQTVINKAVTLAAKWEEIPVYNITFDANGAGGAAPAAVTQERGKSITLPGQGEMAGAAGFLFAGWSANRDGGGDNFAAGSAYSATEDVTLYAKWGAAATVTYSANGGSGTVPSSAAVAAGTKITLPAAGGLTRSGYVFGGWSAGGETYAAGASYTVTADVTISAVWSVNTSPGSITISTSTNIYKLVVKNSATKNTFATYGTGSSVWLASGKTYTVSNVPAGQYQVEATVVTRAGYPNDTYGVTTNLVTVTAGQTVTTRF